MESSTPSHTVFEIAFLDVGQGDCTIASDHLSRSVIIIDCGKSTPARRYLATLEDCGMKVKLIALTHRHLDHYCGFPDVLAHSDLSHLVSFWWCPSFSGDAQQTERCKAVLKHIYQIIQRTSRSRIASSELSTTFGNLTVEVLHPTDTGGLEVEIGMYSGNPRRDGRNDMGLVLRLTCSAGSQSYRFLIGGDVKAEGWKRILANNGDLSAIVFRMPHHGAYFDDSCLSLSLSHVIEAVAPSYAVISVGSTNRYGHPARETIDALLRAASVHRILCTEATRSCSGCACACAGNVVVHIDDSGLSISPSSQEHAQTVASLSTPQCRRSSSS
ncbi:MAG: MBL fold metallo-hydrolase [Armatimonadota bacterium]|nr:MBL fold metallo-hydrolase [Armatimonadota bacterium]